MTMLEKSVTCTLRNTTVLLRLKASTYTGSVTDDEVSREVTQAKKASDGAAKVIKNLMKDVAEHHELTLYRGRMAAWFKQVTYPWDDPLRACFKLDYPRIMDEYTNSWLPGWHQRVEALVSVWPTVIARAAFPQGDMFKREDYPDASEVRRRYKINLYVSEVPEGNFTDLMMQGVAEDLHAEYQQQTNRIVKDIATVQRERLIDVMTSIGECCGYNIKELEDGTQKITPKKIHQDTLKKALAFCDTFAVFNVSDDPELEAARAALEQAMMRYGDVESLRKNASTRAAMQNEMNDILSKFQISI